MKAAHLEFLLEEPSMEFFLRGWLSRRIPNVGVAFRVFQGKNDLLKKLEARLRGYRKWMPDEYRLLVIVDRNGDDCRALKRNIDQICGRAGLKSRTKNPKKWQIAACIAIEELEAWYFGEWDAVLKAYPKASPTIPNKANYRDPDNIAGGTWEAFERVMQSRGYFGGGLQKIQAAREIGARIDAEKSRSPSFRYLARVIDDAV